MSDNFPTWESTRLSQSLIDLALKTGFAHPTSVQSQSIPSVLEGKDVIVSSQTGSGKTASFVLPTVDRFQGSKGTFGLVLCPTREIAQQSQAVFETFGGPLGLKSIALIGGIQMRQDEEALKSYPQIIVATPGRLCDHLDRGNIWLEFIKVLILDEADRMLDMGFSDQLARIMEEVPRVRQTLVYSATFNSSVDRLIHKIMKNPLKVTVGTTSSAPPKIDQRVIWLPHEDDKLGALLKLIANEPGTMIVFAGSKERASRVWRALHGRQIYDATYIHSDCTQQHREQALAEFKSGKYRILVATDVAGRGIDVEDVAHVVNFDLPREPEDYVHRIGRTGRKGKSGIATSLAVAHDRINIKKIERLIGKSISGDVDAMAPFEGEQRSRGPGGSRPSSHQGPHHRSGGAGRGNRQRRGR